MSDSKGVDWVEVNLDFAEMGLGLGSVAMVISLSSDWRVERTFYPHSFFTSISFCLHLLHLELDPPLLGKSKILAPNFFDLPFSLLPSLLCPSFLIFFIYKK